MLQDDATSSKDYRLNVGIMLLNREGKVFVGWRTRISPDLKHGWQMPQGGIDPGETVEQAALRELEEEIGTRRASIIAIAPQLFKYDLPDDLREKSWGGRYKGQAQRWVLLRFEGDDADINLKTEHPEFERWQWIDIDALDELVVPFKKEIYKAIVEEFRAYVPKQVEIQANILGS